MTKYIAVYRLDGKKHVASLSAYSIPDAYRRFEEHLDGENWELLGITVDSVVIEQFGHIQVIIK